MTIVILMMRWDALGSSKCFCSENEWRRWGALVVVVIRIFWGALVVVVIRMFWCALWFLEW